MRKALRALNGAIEAASAGAGLTVQQQAFLLALAAREEDLVPFADVRRELRMDQPTASELLARLGRMGLVRRSPGRDRRSTMVALSPRGLAVLRESIRRTRIELMSANARGDLAAWSDSLAAYLRFYTGAAGARGASRGKARRPRGSSADDAAGFKSRGR